MMRGVRINTLAKPKGSPFRTARFSVLLQTGTLLGIALAMASVAACTGTGTGYDAGPPIALCATPSDGGVDGGPNAGTDAGPADAGPTEPLGVSCDPTSGLRWEVGASTDTLTLDQARSRCKALTLGSYDDWRLPTIDELRSIVRECATSERGSKCLISDPDCLQLLLCWDPSCAGCPANEGPGTGGCYQDTSLDGTCGLYWSSSQQGGLGPATVWVVDFNSAHIFDQGDVQGALSRCVRGVLPEE